MGLHLITAPHPLHTHKVFFIHIYENFQRLLLWLVVIRTQHHTNILWKSNYILKGKGPREQILGLVAAPLTCSRCSRCWIVLHVYKVPAMSIKWMWGLNYKNPLRLQLIHPGHPLSGPIQQISGWSCIPMTCSHNARCWNNYIYIYIYVWSWPARRSQSKCNMTSPT